MELAPSFLQAAAALLIVIGLIYLTAWALRKFSFGNTGMSSAFLKSKSDKKLKLVESLWLDARYRVVLIEHAGHTHSILLGPQQALQLTEPATILKTGSNGTEIHETPSDFLAS